MKAQFKCVEIDVRDNSQQVIFKSEDLAKCLDYINWKLEFDDSPHAVYEVTEIISS